MSFRFSGPAFLWAFLIIVAGCATVTPYRQFIEVENTQTDRFFRQILPRLKNKKVCLITNASTTGRYLLYDSNQGSRPSLLHQLFSDNGSELALVLTPEHGISAHEAEYGKAEMKFKAVTVYRKTADRIAAHFRLCDAVVYDLPDAGIRPYTYRTVLTRSMQAAEQNSQPFYLIDRVNPAAYLGAMGPVVNEKYFSYLGEEVISFYSGYTYGEMALKYRSEKVPRLDLTVLELDDYSHSDHFYETERKFSPPSPNLPHYRSLECYWAGIFFEGTVLEEGRGTKDPFCVFGHPDIKFDHAPESVEGVIFQPVSFIPSSGRYRNRVVNGFRLNITDYDKFDPLRTAYVVLQYLLKNYPEEKWLKTYKGYYALDDLTGEKSFRKALQSGLSFDSWAATNRPLLEKYTDSMQKYRLY